MRLGTDPSCWASHMASITLATSQNLGLPTLAQAVAQSIITVNPMYRYLPLKPVVGNAYAYNRENTLVTAQKIAVGDTITSKGASDTTRIQVDFRRFVRDVEMDSLVEATGSNIIDQEAFQLAQASKAIGRLVQDDMVNGSGTSPSAAGLLTLVDATQIIQPAGAGANGANMTLADLDTLISYVLTGDTQFLVMPSRTWNTLFGLLRSTGGTSIVDMINITPQSVDPTLMLHYRGIPVFRNDYIPITQTRGASTSVCTTVFAGRFDDGSESDGVAMIVPARNAGISVERAGLLENRDERLTRVRWMGNFVLYSIKALAAMNGVLN